MKTENKVLMLQAREALSGKWGLAIGGFVVYELVMIAFNVAVNSVFKLIFGKTVLSNALGSLALYIVMGPLLVGAMFFFLSLSRKQEPVIKDLFRGFSKFWVAVKAYLLMVLFVMLWTLLLIIPGIIAALSYSQIFFILADDDSIGALDAIKKSKKMMEGNKWKFFCLVLRFIGWSLLCILTLGIGFLWLFPYMMVSYAKFYDDIKGGENEQALPQSQEPQVVV